MELKFTGIGAAYYPVLGSNCAFFEHDNCLYLIDCGESTFKAMFSRNEIYDYDNIVVLLTHLHADHIGSLGSFLSFCKNVLDSSSYNLIKDGPVPQNLAAQMEKVLI